MMWFCSKVGDISWLNVLWRLSAYNGFMDADVIGYGAMANASFSSNGIVPSGGPANLLHKDMPVLRFDHDVNEG